MASSRVKGGWVVRCPDCGKRRTLKHRRPECAGGVLRCAACSQAARKQAGRPQRRGYGQGSAAPPAPERPTWAQPGSEAKLRVMERRAAAGLQIFHAEDETVFVESWLGRGGTALSEREDAA